MGFVATKAGSLLVIQLASPSPDLPGMDSIQLLPLPLQKKHLWPVRLIDHCMTDFQNLEQVW